MSIINEKTSIEQQWVNFSIFLSHSYYFSIDYPGRLGCTDEKNGMNEKLWLTQIHAPEIIPKKYRKVGNI